MILLTGGSGLLGRQLKPLLPDCVSPSRDYFDVVAPRTMPRDIDMIVHCAAYTDVLKAEDDVERCCAVNIVGTRNMASLTRRLVYISTEYVFDGMRGDYSEDDAPNPVNTYARSKLMGEHQARAAERHLIIRCLFKPRPFEHERACVDQWTSGDYVDVMAPLIAEAVRLFADGELQGVIHLGTGRKSTYELARQSREVEPVHRGDIPVQLPRDTSLNTNKWHNLTKNRVLH